MRKIFIVIMLIPIIYIGLKLIFGLIFAANRIDWDIYKDYLYFFPEYVIKDLSETSGSYVHKNKYVYNGFFYKNTYHIGIWDLKNLKYLQIGDVDIYNPSKINQFKLKNIESLYPNSVYEILIRLKYNFDNGMIVKPDMISDVDTMFFKSSYKGFIGRINKILLCNKFEEDMVLINFDYPKDKVLFMIYKTDKNFFIIILHSSKDFGMDALNIFNLEEDFAKTIK